MISGLQNQAVTPGTLAQRHAGGPDPSSCGKCHERGKVLGTKPYPGYRWIRHACLRCGHRWTTYETFLSPHRVRLRPR